jgi:hypothetical protein
VLFIFSLQFPFQAPLLWHQKSGAGPFDLT